MSSPKVARVSAALQVAPYFQLVAQQKPRQDLQYVTPEPEESDTEDDSNDTDLEMEPWILEGSMLASVNGTFFLVMVLYP